MKVPNNTPSRIILPLAIVLLFFLALIWFSYWRQSSFEREEAIHYATERNSNLAVALEQYALRTIRNADEVLQMMRMEYRDGDSSNLHELMVKNLLGRDIIDGAVIIGTDGRPRVSSIDNLNRIIPDFSNAPYFIFHSRNSKDTLLISQPLSSKLSGETVVVLSRRINDIKGRFAGVVAVQVPPVVFTSFYARAKLLPNDIISLVAPNGITYARRTGQRETSGENINKSPLFKHLANNSDSFYFARDAIRDVPTWFSYRKLKDYPVIATVGSSEADVFADYSGRRTRYVIPRIIISVFVVLFFIVTARFLVQRTRISERIAHDEKKYQRLLTEQVIEGQEKERERIGGELHDNINQVLTTIKLYLETASTQVNNPLIERSMKLLNNSINEIRNLSHQLSAPTLGTRSLIDSIYALLENIEYSTDIKFEFDHSGYGTPLIMSQKLAIYRILQEQLNNILKHANASSVWIKLSQANGNVVLTVRDNGKGFDPSSRQKGLGINNMISRAKVFAGQVHFESEMGYGCLCTVNIPLACQSLN